MIPLPPILSGFAPKPKQPKAQADPAWLTTLHSQPGTLDGVPFRVDGHNSKFGRKTVVHDYPGRDLPYVEDLGRKGRHFTIQAFIVGADYMKGRDALLAVVEKPGLKRLVHPWIGRVNVSVVGDVDLVETIKEGGMAVFTLVLLESAGNVTPVVAPDTASATVAAVKTAHLSVIASMSAAVMNAASYVQDQMSGLIDEMNTGFQSLVADLPFPPGAMSSVLSAGEAAIMGKNPLSALLGQWSTPAGILSSVVSFASGGTGLFANLVNLGYVGLLRTGALSSLGVGNNFFGGSPVPVPNLVVKPQSAAILPQPYSARPMTPMRLIQAMSPNISWPVLPANTPTQIEAANNAAAMRAAVAQVFAIEQARLSSALAYSSQQDAFAVRDYVCGQLATLAMTAEYGVYVALRQLQAAVYADLTAQGNADPQVISFTSAATLPAIVVAYNLYGDASRESDILSRNPSIANPVFVAGGTALEVLSA